MNRYLIPLLLLAAPLTTAAQTPPRPDDNGTPNAAGASHPATRPSDNPPGPALRTSPSKPLQPAAATPDLLKLGGFPAKPATQPSTFIREGSFVFNRPARLAYDADGKPQLLFDPPAGAGKAPPPVRVLPNLKRMALEDAAKGRGLPLVVSGVATEYGSHNYLLLDDNTRPAGAPDTAPAAPATRPAGPNKNLSADQLLGQMLRSAPGSAAVSRPAQLRWDQPPATDATSGGGAVKPGAPPVTLLREGRYLPERLGRLSRSADGSTAEFTIESDGAALRDPPLIILPCVKLATMEAQVLGANKDLRFRLSGTVTEYRGRNYVLPEKVVIVPDVVQQF